MASLLTLNGYPLNQSKKKPGKSDKATLKTMVIADPGVAFVLSLDLPGYADRVTRMTLSFTLGPSAEEVHHRVDIGLGVPSGLLDLSQDLLFVTPFIDAHYGQEISQSQTPFFFTLNIQLFQGSTLILPGAEDPWTLSFSGETPAAMVKAGTFRLLSAPGSSLPLHTPSPVDDPHPVTYSDILYHQEGLTYRLLLPPVTQDAATNAITRLWVNGSPAHFCNMGLAASTELDHPFSMDEHCLVWMPYPHTKGEAFTLSTGHINVEVFPQTLGLSNLNQVTTPVPALNTQRITIDVS